MLQALAGVNPQVRMLFSTSFALVSNFQKKAKRNQQPLPVQSNAKCCSRIIHLTQTDATDIGDVVAVAHTTGKKSSI